MKSLKKWFVTAVLFLFLTTSALAYGPEGYGVYRGMIQNHTTEHVDIVILDEAKVEVFVQHLSPHDKELYPQLQMPYKKYGSTFVPNLRMFKKNIARFVEENGGYPWEKNILLKPGKYEIRFRVNEGPNGVKKGEWKVILWNLTEEDAAKANGPYVISIED